MKTSKFTLLILPLLFFACKKDPPIDPEPTEPVMPPLTHQGLNTFGCYINGELFVANGGWSVWSIPPVSGSYDEIEKRLIIQGRRYNDEETEDREDVMIRSDITHAEGVYNYRYNEEYGSDGYINWVGGCNYYYLDDNPDLGKLTITYLNIEENIISGTFYINLFNPDCDIDTALKITDGRFDFQY